MCENHGGSREFGSDRIQYSKLLKMRVYDDPKDPNRDSHHSK